jgi:hypothetical protein
MAKNSSKFLDEFGSINKNAYYSSWNSYALYENGGKWAIQNGGDAGTAFWTINDNNTITGKSSNPIEKSYQFIIIPVGTLTGIEELRPNSEPEVQGSELYDLSGRRIINGKGLRIRRGRKFVAR